MKQVVFLFFIVYTLAPTFIAAQVDGTPDYSFNQQSYYISGNGNYYAMAVGLQSTGKIIVAGQGFMVDRSFIARHESAGALDPTFGTMGGMQLFNFYSNTTTLMDMVVLPNDKIVMAGRQEITNAYQGLCARFMADGTIDWSFAVQGQNTFGPANGMWNFNAIALQPDGKILVCGTSSISVAVLGRLTANGFPDTTFGSNGFVQFTPFDSLSRVELFDMAIQDDGKILATGKRYTSDGGVGSYSKSVTFRLNPDGSADSSFGIGGEALYFIPRPRFNYFNRIHLMDDGRMVLTGTIIDEYCSEFAVIRLLTDGQLDPSFGNNGISRKDYTDTTVSISCTSSLLQRDGKIVLTSPIFFPTDSTFISLLRLDASGSIDSSFGTMQNGFTIHHMAHENTHMAGAACWDAQGEMLLCGLSRTCTSAGCGSPYYNLSRYMNSVSNSTVLEAAVKEVITVYPVPFSDKLKIEWQETQRVEVFDAKGTCVFTSSGEREYEIDSRSWSAGVYIVKAGQYRRTVVKQ